MTDAVLEALWKRVLGAWDDAAAHGKFLEHCRETGQLLEAAVRYRGMAGDHVRGPSAQKRLQGITVLAMAELEAQRSDEARSWVDWPRIFLIVFFVAASAALLLALRR